MHHRNPASRRALMIRPDRPDLPPIHGTNNSMHNDLEIVPPGRELGEPEPRKLKVHGRVRRAARAEAGRALVGADQVVVAERVVLGVAAEDRVEVLRRHVRDRVGRVEVYPDGQAGFGQGVVPGGGEGGVLFDGELSGWDGVRGHVWCWLLFGGGGGGWWLREYWGRVAAPARLGERAGNGSGCKKDQVAMNFWPWSATTYRRPVDWCG